MNNFLRAIMEKKILKLKGVKVHFPVKAGIFKAASIKTAAAAKVIENTQRDINIALVNELSLIFKKEKLAFSFFKNSPIDSALCGCRGTKTR